VRGIGLVNDLTLEQFDEFSASVEIQNDAQDCGVTPHVVLSAKP
jgi:hypothetical protein